FALDQLHRAEAFSILFAVICHPRHVWVTNVRGRTGLTQETRPRARILRDFPIDDLEGNMRIQNCIARAVSNGRRSCAELSRKTICFCLHFEVGVSQWSRC